MAPEVFFTIWLAFVGLAVLSLVRTVDRYFDIRHWARRPGYKWLHHDLPLDFPIELIHETAFYTDITNCVLSVKDGRRRIAFDLRLNPYSRYSRWVTIVAVEGRITADHPWPHASQATAYNSSHWIIFQPCVDFLGQDKPWIFRLVDAFPPRQRLLEPNAIMYLWREAGLVAQPPARSAEDLVIRPRPNAFLSNADVHDQKADSLTC